MRMIVWAGTPIIIGLILVTISPDNIGDLILPISELSIVLGAILYSSIDRKSSFFVRAVIHLAAMFYVFFSFLAFRALTQFFPEEKSAFLWSFTIWLLIMVSQFFVTCPRCKAFYSLMYCDDTNPVFSEWYAPWVGPKCARCGRSKSLPNDQERK